MKHTQKLFSNAKSTRAEVEDEINEIFDYITPERSFREVGQIADRSRIYDTTALRSLGVLTTTVLANFIPVGREWVKLTQTKASKASVGLNAVLEAALQTETDKFFSEINKSNFSQQMGLVIEGLIETGTAQIGVEWRDNKLNFVASPWQTIYFNTAENKRVKDIFKRHQLPIRYIRDNWPKTDFPPSFDKELLANPNATATVIEHAVKMEKTNKRYTQERPYIFDISLETLSNSGKDWTTLETNETTSPRLIVARWALSVNSDWGQGVGHQARNDILSVNELAQTHLESAEFRAQPPGFTDDETLANTAIEKGKLYYSKSGVEFAQFTDVSILSQDILALQTQIKLLFHDATLPPVQQTGVMTATEVTVRQSEFFRSLGQVAVMLEEELLKPLVETVTAILKDVKVMDDIPFGADKDADFEFFSLVRKSKDIESVRNDLEALQSLSIFGPEVINSLVDIPGLSGSILSRLNFSAEFIKDAAEVEQAQQQKQMVDAATQVAGNLGATTTKANPIQQILNNVTGGATPQP